MNKQSREEYMGIRLYRYADKGEFRVISTGSCLLSEITGGTRHWFASPRSAHYKLDLLAGHALHPVTSRACGIACITRRVHQSSLPVSLLWYHVHVVRGWPSQIITCTQIKYSIIRDYFCARWKIRSHFSCGGKSIFPYHC